MRKTIFTLLVLFVGLVAYGQNGEKSLKMASKSLNEYLKDPFVNTVALNEAKEHLANAFADKEVSSNPKSWVTRGEIFFNIADSQIKSKLLNPDAKITAPKAALESLASFKKVLEIAEKKGEIKDAIKGLEGLEGILNNYGIECYKEEDFIGAYENFKGEITTSDLLRANQTASRLDEGNLYGEKLYFAGLTAYYAQEYQNSINYLKQAKENKYSDATLYHILFEGYRKVNKEEEGLPFLTEGRKEFPDDTGLLFSEINYYLTKGELQKMIGNLEEALAQEPDNSSVLLTLGQVYDQLHVKANDAGDKEMAVANFNKALDYYKLALSKDQENFELNYSLGALYYNKAATLTPSLNAAAEDFTAAGTKKYESIKLEMGGYFEKALPYFLKSDALNDKDRNTIIALKEIYARMDQFDKSNSYKARLESLTEN